MHGLMENAVYGGRVDNDYDMRVVQSFLKSYFNKNVICGKVYISFLSAFCVTDYFTCPIRPVHPIVPHKLGSLVS